MRLNWSIRRATSVALLLCYASVLPLLGIVYYRLFQVRGEAPAWARLAQASRWLSVGVTCGGAASSEIAREDLERWRDALSGLVTHDSIRGRQSPLGQHLRVLMTEVEQAWAGDSGQWVPWVRSHCEEVGNLAELALQHAIDLGLDPSSRADRYEDLALRDVTAYVAVWIVVAVGLFIGLRRFVVRPTAKLGRVLNRIAAGDLSAEIPRVGQGEMLALSRAVEAAIETLQQNRALAAERVVEVRALVRRLIGLMEQPALVIGVDYRVDYANEAAATAFGEERSLEGVELERLPGGDAVMAAVDHLVQAGEAHNDRMLDNMPAGMGEHLAQCAVVRDGRGNPRRVIVLLRAVEGSWWRRLWKGEAPEGGA